MAWSYRSDRSDEVYHDQVGPAQVKGEALHHTPANAEHADELKKAQKPDPEAVKAIKESTQKQVETTKAEQEAGTFVNPSTTVTAESETEEDTAKRKKR